MARVIHRALLMLGVHRWSIGAGVYGILLAALSLGLLGPLLGSQVGRATDLVKMLRAAGRSAEMAAEASQLSAQAAALDSLAVASQSVGHLDNTAVVGFIYSLADSVGCASGKVQTGQPVAAEQAQETPFVFSGEGSWEAIARFVDGIENMSSVTRVRQVSIARTGDDRGSVTVDFVVIEPSGGR